MDEREAAQNSDVIFDPAFWFVLTVFCGAYLSKALITNEPFNKGKFWGELILALITGVAFYAGGLLQGMSVLQMVFLGSLSALGTVRGTEWIIKALMAFKRVD